MYSSSCILVTFLLVGSSLVQAILQRSEYGDKLDNLSKMLHSSCVALVDIDESVIEQVQKGDIPDDPKLKKYVKCLMISSTAMDDNGELNKDFMVQTMPAQLSPKVAAVIDTCTPKVKAAASLEDKAFAFLTCVFGVNRDLFFFF